MAAPFSKANAEAKPPRSVGAGVATRVAGYFAISRYWGRKSLPGDVHLVVTGETFFEKREELGVGTVVGEQLERVAIDEVVLVVVMLFFELRDEKLQLLVVDGSDLVSSIEANQTWHARESAQMTPVLQGAA